MRIRNIKQLKEKKQPRPCPFHSRVKLSSKESKPNSDDSMVLPHLPIKTQPSYHEFIAKDKRKSLQEFNARLQASRFLKNQQPITSNIQNIDYGIEKEYEIDRRLLKINSFDEYKMMHEFQEKGLKISHSYPTRFDYLRQEKIQHLKEKQIYLKAKLRLTKIYEEEGENVKNNIECMEKINARLQMIKKIKRDKQMLKNFLFRINDQHLNA